MSERTSAEVEREVVAQRHAVEETLEALRTKLSSGQILNSLARSFTGAGGQGGELMGNLARQVRDNPLPVALTGVGLAWLLTSQGVRGARRVAEAAQKADLTVYDHARYSADVEAHGVDHAVRELIDGRYDVRTGVAQPPEGSLDEEKIAADEARHGADYVVRQLKAGGYRAPAPERVTATYDRSRLAADEKRFGAAYVSKTHLAGGVAKPPEPAAAPVTKVKADVEVRAPATAGRDEDFGDRVADFADSARVAGRRIQRSLDEAISGEPFVTGIVGVALGVVLGALLPWPPQSQPPRRQDKRRDTPQSGAK